MPATSRSSGPSTRIGTSSLTNCFNCIGTSKISSSSGGRQRGGEAGLSDHLRRVGGRFLKRLVGRRLDIRANREVGRHTLGNRPENRTRGFAAVVTLRVRFVEKHSDADFGAVCREEADERGKIFARTIRRFLPGTRLASDRVVFQRGLGRRAAG